MDSASQSRGAAELKLGDPIATPAFIYSAEDVVRTCRLLRTGIGSMPVHVLYTLKACRIPAVLELTRELVDGFAVASPAEAMLARKIGGPSAELHITSPGMKSEWFEESWTATHVAFNSLSQLRRIQHAIPADTSMGIRLNPGVSEVEDPRYDPCRPYSKLGVPVEEFVEFMAEPNAARIEGLHFHNACDFRSWSR